MAKKHWWLNRRMLTVTGFCVLLALLHPVGIAFSQIGDGKTWTKVVSVEVVEPVLSACSAGNGKDEAFGRQLDILTSFYTTIITLSLALFAVVAAFAFFTISFVSRERAEEIARSVLESKDFRNRIDQKVEERVDVNVEDIRDALAEFQVAYEATNKNVPVTPDATNEGEKNGNS